MTTEHHGPRLFILMILLSDAHLIPLNIQIQKKKKKKKPNKTEGK